MKVWFNNKKNAVLALRCLFRDGADMRAFDRSEVRIEPATSATGRLPIGTKSYRPGVGWQEQRHGPSMGYYLVIPDPIAPRHAELILKWARQQTGGTHPSMMGMGFANAGDPRVALRDKILNEFRWRLARARIDPEKTEYTDVVVRIVQAILAALDAKYGRRVVDSALHGISVPQRAMTKRRASGDLPGAKFAFQSDGPRVANPIPVHDKMSPEERYSLAEKSAKEFNRKGPVRRGRLRRLRLSQLRSLQPTVDASTVATYRRRRKPLKVARVKGRWVILDGNHCAAQCHRAGDKHVAVEDVTSVD